MYGCYKNATKRTKKAISLKSPNCMCIAVRFYISQGLGIVNLHIRTATVVLLSDFCK